MSNQESRSPCEGISSPQCSAATSTIRGDYSGTSGSRNIMNAGNTTTTTTHNYYSQRGTNSSQNYADILQCLYTSEYESHRNRVREPVEGTCTWVTKHPKYIDWLENRSSGLLWLSADPGCGKSVIASFLVRHLEVHTDAIVCYFFFKDDSDEQKSAKFALCAILHQLFMRKKELCKFAEEEFAAKGRRFTVEVGTLWRILVKTATRLGPRNVICVLDALDECEEVSLTRLVRHINRLPTSQTSGTVLKFIATSRPYHRIEKELDSRTTTIRLRGEDEVNSTTADVTRVIDDGINELELVWRNPGGLGYLRNLLESSADRTFLWVSLVLEILKDSQECSWEGYTDILSAPPRDLAEFYTKILDKSADEDKARRILNIVVAAARPLTLREMNVAFRMSPDRRSIGDLEDIPTGFQKTIKNLCGLFVRIIDSKVYLVHQTAREFLIKGTLSGQGKWQYTLRTMDSSFFLADICISYLSLEDFENNQLAIELLDNVGYTSGRLVRNFVQRYAFLDYAGTHWAGHFQDSHDRQMELFEPTRVICEARSNRFLTWLMVYWQDSDWYCPFPKDFTHLMIATWLGQWRVVKQLLEEGRDINARAKQYGTALNIAALRKHEGITRMLLEIRVNAYLGEKEYNILNTKKSELEELKFEFFRREFGELLLELFKLRRLEELAIDFLKAFCATETPGPNTLGPGTPDPGAPDPATLGSRALDTRTPDPGTLDPGTPDPGTPGLVTLGSRVLGTPDPDPGTPDPVTLGSRALDTRTPDPGAPDLGTPDLGIPGHVTLGPRALGTPDPCTPDPDTLGAVRLGPHTPGAYTQGPRTLDPRTSSPHTPDRGAPDLCTPDSVTLGPRTPDPVTPDPRTPRPRRSNSHRSNPRTSNPRRPGPRKSNSHRPNPRTPDSGTPDPVTPDPRTPRPRRSNSRRSNPRTSNPRALGPRRSNSRRPNPRTSNSRALGPRRSNSHRPNPRTPDSGTPDPAIPDPRTPRPRRSNSRRPNPRTSNPRALGPRRSNSRRPDPVTPDLRTPNPRILGLGTQDQDTDNGCCECSLC